MGIVQSADRDHDMAHPDVQLRQESFLDPELLQLHLAAFLHLLLPFPGFFELPLGRYARTGMLELDLGLHRPAFSEIVAQVDDGMGNIETPMALAHMRRRARIPIYIVAVEIPRQGHFTVPSHR